jgi:hypothetical protein
MARSRAIGLGVVAASCAAAVMGLAGVASSQDAAPAAKAAEIQTATTIARQPDSLEPTVPKANIPDDVDGKLRNLLAKDAEFRGVVGDAKFTITDEGTWLLRKDGSIRGLIVQVDTDSPVTIPAGISALDTPAEGESPAQPYTDEHPYDVATTRSEVRDVTRLLLWVDLELKRIVQMVQGSE